MCHSEVSKVLERRKDKRKGEGQQAKENHKLKVKQAVKQQASKQRRQNRNGQYVQLVCPRNRPLLLPNRPVVPIVVADAATAAATATTGEVQHKARARRVILGKVYVQLKK